MSDREFLLARLDQLVGQFGGLPAAQVGRGPAHPTQPNFDMGNDLHDFLASHNFLQDDPGYILFLARYCGAALNDRPNGVVVDILGMAGVSLDLVGIPGSMVDDFGIATFATAERTIRNSGTNDIRNRYAYFGFDATGKRLAGVYQCAHDSGEDPQEWRWAYPSFLDWLETVVGSQGRIVPG